MNINNHVYCDYWHIWTYCHHLILCFLLSKLLVVCLWVYFVCVFLSLYWCFLLEIKFAFSFSISSSLELVDYLGYCCYCLFVFLFSMVNLKCLKYILDHKFFKQNYSGSLFPLIRHLILLTELPRKFPVTIN